MEKTLVWRTEGRLSVAIHGETSPTELEWGSYINDARTNTHPELRVLVVSHGGSPDGAQRRALAEMFKRQITPPVALMTGSRLVRGLTLSFSFFNPKVRAFDLDALTEAFDFLSLARHERSRAVLLIDILEKELGVARPISHNVRRRAL